VTARGSAQDDTLVLWPSLPASPEVSEHQTPVAHGTPLVAGFSGTGGLGCEVSFGELAVEEIEDETVETVG
jgi:hypothetical protein